MKKYLILLPLRLSVAPVALSAKSIDQAYIELHQGRAGIPYAAYLAFATVGFIAYGTYGASP